jgi:hypothetical protein
MIAMVFREMPLCAAGETDGELMGLKLVAGPGLLDSPLHVMSFEPLVWTVGPSVAQRPVLKHQVSESRENREGRTSR